MTQRIPLLFCCDPSYLQHLAVTMVSLLENSQGTAYDVTIVTRTPFSDTLQALLRETVAPYRDAVCLRIVTFAFPDDIQFPINARLAPDAYLRIWVERFYPPTVERIIYLDCDVIVLGDLSEIWATELGTKLIAAVPIPGSDRWRLHQTPEACGYFNSGVMLLNLKAWREQRCEATALHYVKSYPERLLDADQDALNACFYNSWVPLAFEWNVISAFFKASHPLGLSDPVVASIQQNAKLVHFTGVAKPWLFRCDHPRASEYSRYLKLTPWRAYVPADRTLPNILKKLALQLLPRRAVRAYRRLRETGFGHGHRI